MKNNSLCDPPPTDSKRMAFNPERPSHIQVSLSKIDFSSLCPQFLLHEMYQNYVLPALALSVKMYLILKWCRASVICFNH